MRALALVALILSLSAAAPVASAPDGSAGDWVFPGEYESHEAMWMLWPTYENKAGFPSTTVVSDMTAAMSGHTHVNLAVQDAADEAAAREFLLARGVPLDHVHFVHIPHGDLWARDMGPQFVRNRLGNLAVSDWNLNYWGYEEPDSERSLFDEPFDRDAASAVDVRTLDTRPGPTGVRMVHEGGSASHNGHGTMIVVESVVMQRNLGPGRFGGGRAPATDFSQPNTYAPNPDWPACRTLVEAEYRRLLGVKKFIWVPTGLIEDTATFRGALAPLFPGREIVQISADNVIRGGGGMNCITQQQPASTRFGDARGWAKVKVDMDETTLYAGPRGSAAFGTVSRLSPLEKDIYLEKLWSSHDRVLVRVDGPSPLAGQVGWVNENAIESAGEKSPPVH